MSIIALVTGRLVADPDRRTGQTGKAFVLARIAAHDGDADALVSVMAFGTAAETLAALGKGDTVAVNGRAKVTTWTGRDGVVKSGLSVTADVVLSVYQLRRKRQAVTDAGAGAEAGLQRAVEPAREDGDIVSDDAWLTGGGVGR